MCIAYGVGLIGLIVSACLYLHVAAKYLFVRILRDSRHLQANTWIHWTTWLGCTTGLGVLSFVLAEAIPIFNYLLALTGSLCFAPMAIALPGWLWLHDHPGWWRRGASAGQKLAYGFHVFLIPVGMYFLIAGTYGVVQEIMAAYADGQIGLLDPLKFFGAFFSFFSLFTDHRVQVLRSLALTTVVLHEEGGISHATPGMVDCYMEIYSARTRDRPAVQETANACLLTEQAGTFSIMNIIWRPPFPPLMKLLTIAPHTR